MQITLLKKKEKNFKNKKIKKIKHSQDNNQIKNEKGKPKQKGEKTPLKTGLKKLEEKKLEEDCSRLYYVFYYTNKKKLDISSINALDSISYCIGKNRTNYQFFCSFWTNNYYSIKIYLINTKIKGET